MPSGRAAAPLASASALALVFLGRIDGEPTFDVDRRLRRARRRGRAGSCPPSCGGSVGRAVGLEQVAARLVGVGGGRLAGPRLRARRARRCGTSRSTGASRRGGWPSAWSPWPASASPVELVLTSAVRSERQRTPWLAALRDEFGEAAPLTFAVVASGPDGRADGTRPGAALPPGGPLPARHHLRRRRPLRAEPGDLPADHRDPVAPHRARRLHPGGARRAGRRPQRADRARARHVRPRPARPGVRRPPARPRARSRCIEPIPGGATVLAAPSDQRDIADEGARIIRHAEGLDTVADYVEAQTTPYRQVRELGEEVPMASRIIKVANAFDDLTGGRDDPAEIQAANERIHLGLGYQYDPDVVEALAVATSDTTVGQGRGARARRALASGAPPHPPERSRGSPDARHLHRRVGIERVHRQPAGARHPEPASRSPSCGWAPTRRAPPAPTATAPPTSRRSWRPTRSASSVRSAWRGSGRGCRSCSRCWPPAGRSRSRRTPAPSRPRTVRADHR